MTRKPIICSLLLLPLWLVATAGDCLSLPVSGAVVYNSQAAISAASGHSQGRAANDLVSFKHFLRHAARRSILSEITDGRLVSSGDSEAVASPELKFGTAGIDVAMAPAELVNGWQFLTRAACEPRAPSEIS